MSAASLIGSWHLLTWEIDYGGGKPLTEPYGPDPQGLIMYTGDGWMSAVISRSSRAVLPAGVSPRDMAPQLVAQAYWSFFQYAGRYRIEGAEVVHEVTQALVPAMVGTEQRRLMRFEGDSLYLQGVETFNDRSRRHILHWQREST